MTLAEHVKGYSTFVEYREGHLYYVTDSGLQFPIPIEDTHGATFIREEKSIYFMRWIRKYLYSLEEANNAKDVL